MTNEQRHHRNVSRQRRFTISDVQKEKMHEAAQQQLLQMSDVQKELKRKHRCASQQKHYLWTEEHIQSHSEYRKRRRIQGQGMPSNEHGQSDNSCIRKGNNADGEIDHLLILAQSAELLLESEHNFAASHKNSQSPEADAVCIPDEKYKEKQHDATKVEVNAGAGKSILLLQGKTRLSHLRRQARSRNNKFVQEVHEAHVLGHMGHQSFEDAQSVEREHAKQVKEALDSRDGEEPAAKCNSRGVDRRMNLPQVHEELGCSCAEGTTELCHSHMVDKMYGDQVHEEMDHKHNAAQRWKERIHIMDEQEHRKRHLFLNAPPQQLEVTDERQLSVRQHVIEQQQMQMTYELQIRERQNIARQARRQRTNERREKSGKQQHDHTHQQQRHILIEQMHTPSERPKEQLFAIEPQWHIAMSDVHKDHRDAARQRRLLRTCERKKQLSRKRRRAIRIRGNPMAGEQRSEMCVTEQCVLPPTSTVLGGQQLGVDHQWLLQMHGIQTEQHQIAAGEHRAQQVEEQRASQNADDHLPRREPSKASNFGQWTPNIHVPTMNERSDELLLEVEHNLHQPTRNNYTKDHRVEHHPQETQVTVNTEDVKNVSCVKGRIRLNQLRHQARLKYASFVEEKHEGQMDHQNRKGRTRLNQLRRQARLRYAPFVEEKQEEPKARQNNEGEERTAVGEI